MLASNFEYPEEPQIKLQFKYNEEDSSLTVNARYPNGNVVKEALSKISPLKPEQMTGLKAKGLYGNVKTVAANNGEFILFNQSGNIISRKSKDGDKYTYSYTNQSQYMVEGYGPYIITFTDNQRIETDTKEPDVPMKYTFDNQGRVTEYQFLLGMSICTEAYMYEASEKLPNTMIFNDHTKEGEELRTDVYEYITVDIHGNWTKRKVTSIKKSTEYVEDGNDKVTTQTKTYYEPRTINYYENADVTATTNDPIDATLKGSNFIGPENGEFVASAPSSVAVGDQFRLNYTMEAENIRVLKLRHLAILRC